MPKTVQGELLSAMKRNPDNQFFVNLTKYLQLRIDMNMLSFPGQSDMDEVKRIQGRVLELQLFLKELTRRPIQTQESGGFDQ